MLLLLDNQIIKYVSRFTNFNPVGDITNNEVFKMLSDKDKKYTHCLIKDKYINSNPLRELKEIEVYDKNNVTYYNGYFGYFCVFKDELNRNIIAYTENINEDKYIPKIYQAEYKELIQSYKDSYSETHLFYYKDVLDLNDIKDYLFICNFNCSCHILLLNKNTKLFELKKVIQNSNIYLKVIPNNNFKDNLIIIYASNTDSNQDMYELETDNAEKISELDKVAFKYYHSYYEYDMLNYKENAYLIECSQNRVRLFYSNKNHKKFKAFKIASSEDIRINHAIIIDINKDKLLYCSDDSRKIHLFDFEDQILIKTIENAGSSIFRLSTSSLLCFGCDEDNEFKILDIESNNLIKTIVLEKKDYLLYILNPIMLNSNNNYFALTTESNELSFVKINI